jgi:hypothetical protein
MIEGKCLHQRRTKGVLQCDLSRTRGKSSVYSATLEMGICEQCGHVQLYCESHELVTNWLAKKRLDGGST